jgi:hypothetical protein
MNDCSEPNCQHSEKRKKCIKPNPYIEALAYCKRNNIPFYTCITEYNNDKVKARNEACNRYQDKSNYEKYTKQKKECLEGKMINPKTGRCIKIRKIKECPSGKIRNPRTNRCVKNLILKSRNIIFAAEIKPPIHSFRFSTRQDRIKSRLPRLSSNHTHYMNIKSSRVKPIPSMKIQYDKNLTKYVSKPTRFVTTNIPQHNSVSRDSIFDKTRIVKFKEVKVKRQPFIADLYDNKVKKELIKHEKTSLQKSLSKSSSLSYKTKVLRPILKHHYATKIQKYLKKNILTKYFSLTNRVKYYQYVLSLIKDINHHSCIRPKKFITKDGKIHEGYNIDNKIDLEKQIGTVSVYGVIYKTSVKNMLGRSPIASKLIVDNKESVLEVKMNENISKYVIEPMISRHFLLSYKTFRCSDNSKDVPPNIKMQEYFVCLNELAHGDLFNLCDNALFMENDELVINVACQCLLSIITFHKMGYIHRDTHWGNFLYHMIEDKRGYYHYIINDKNYYLKNCIYNMMLSDFGIVNKFSPKVHKIYDYVYDLNRVLMAFKNKNYQGWSKFSTLPSTRISQFIDNLSGQLHKAASNNQPLDKIIEIILIAFLNSPCRGIFMNIIPPNDKILNDMPYTIDDKTLGNLISI